MGVNWVFLLAQFMSWAATLPIVGILTAALFAQGLYAPGGPHCCRSSVCEAVQQLPVWCSAHAGKISSMAQQYYEQKVSVTTQVGSGESAGAQSGMRQVQGVNCSRRCSIVDDCCYHSMIQTITILDTQLLCLHAGDDTQLPNHSG
jgi:hypothetical protein